MDQPIDWHALSAKERIEISLRSTGPFFVTGEDGVQLAAMNSATGVTLTLAGRFMQLNGQVTAFTHTLTPATDRTLSSAFRQLGNGWILNCNVLATSGSPMVGQCWVRVNILRGSGGATTVLGTLVAGYVTNVQPIAFPGGDVRGPLDGAGALRSITGTDPAAGAEISEVVPTGVRWVLHSILIALVTDATVSNRRPVLEIDDGTNTLFTIDSAQALTAGANWSLSFTGQALSVATLSFAGRIASNFPVPLRSGYRIRTDTVNLQAGDDYGAPQLLVEEWITGV